MRDLVTDSLGSLSAIFKSYVCCCSFILEGFHVLYMHAYLVPCIGFTLPVVSLITPVRFILFRVR